MKGHPSIGSFEFGAPFVHLPYCVFPYYRLRLRNAISMELSLFNLRRFCGNIAIIGDAFLRISCFAQISHQLPSSLTAYVFRTLGRTVSAFCNGIVSIPLEVFKGLRIMDDRCDCPKAHVICLLHSLCCTESPLRGKTGRQPAN